jgi:hypothetical protein
MPSTERERSRQMAISFDEAPLWDSASLEAALVREALQPLQLTLTDNRSVLLSFCRKRGAVQLPAATACSCTRRWTWCARSRAG